jgi:hypothetical protein
MAALQALEGFGSLAFWLLDENPAITEFDFDL